MKWFIRLFFRTLRRILGPIILLADKVTTPKGIVRTPEKQQLLDDITKNFVLYQFKTCPFCIKVRRTTKRLSLNIDTRDAQRDSHSRDQLLQGGGQIKVPCLKIMDESGNATWMYESNDIIQYLHNSFA